jgi:chitinase domain-containing protein 1
MTYDFSGPNQPGPNAPASWVKKCLQNLPKSKGGAASNVLLGLNFYGNDFILPQGREAQGTWSGLHAINHLIVIIEFNQVYLLDFAGPV